MDVSFHLCGPLLSPEALLMDWMEHTPAELLLSDRPQVGQHSEADLQCVPPNAIEGEKAILID